MRPWELALGTFLLFLLVACVLIPLLVVDAFKSQYNEKRKQKYLSQNRLGSAASSSLVTTVNLPSQCSAYTTDSDPTRHYTYNSTTSACDNSNPFGTSSVWIRFTGAPGSALANGAVPVNRCGTTMSGYYNGTLPSVGATVQGTVCFASNANTCFNPTTISVTNCNGFYIYYLTAVPSCPARYCTV